LKIIALTRDNKQQSHLTR